MIKKDWIVVYIIFIGAFSVQLIVSLAINGWHFAYPLDDPYIHLAIAKNFAAHGVWGPTQYQFASSSSSILFSLLISFFFIIGLKTLYIPILLNLIATGVLVYIIQRIAIREGWGKKVFIIIVSAVLIFMPAIALIYSGMEHIFQTITVLLLIYYSVNILNTQNKLGSLTILLSLALLSVGFRYEALFTAFVIALIFLLKRKFREFIFLSLGTLLPVVIFGMISMANGDYFLPNTLLVKGLMPKLTFMGILWQASLWIYRAFRYPHILAAFILLSFNIISAGKGNRNLNNKWFTFSLILCFSMILHLSFAGIGWFYRYEAYLVVISIIAFAPWLNKVLKERGKLFSLLFANKKAFALSVIVLAPLMFRTGISFYKNSFAPSNIYSQQVQMAYFVKANNYKSVVLNDIGAVCYFNDIHLLDLNGLASTKIIEARKANKLDRRFLDSITKANNCSLAIIYDGVVPFKFPGDWQKAGEWTISHNVICWKSKVNFYSLKPGLSKTLSSDLKAYTNKLPPGVKVSIFAMDK